MDSEFVKQESKTDGENNVEKIDTKEFCNITKECVNDIMLVFPEFKDTFNLNNFLDKINSYDGCLEILEYCRNRLPRLFFDILNKNENIFKEESTDTEFIPGINFSYMFNCENTSDSTKETIWKYLQLLVFSVIGTVNSNDSDNVFGETAKIFESINKDEFKSKINDVVEQMKQSFENKEKDENLGDGKRSGINEDSIPNAEKFHEHISGLLDGKLGKLAREIAEETAKDLTENGIDLENATDVNDVVSNLVKDPTKLMGLVRNVGDKLDKKLNSGEIKQEELMKEAGDIFSKMKNMPGMDNLQNLFGQFGNMPNMPNMPNSDQTDDNNDGDKKKKKKKQRVNPQMQNHLKKMQTQQRLLKKLEERKNENNNNNKLEKLSSNKVVDMRDIEALAAEIEGISSNKKVKKSKK